MEVTLERIESLPGESILWYIHASAFPNKDTAVVVLIWLVIAVLALIGEVLTTGLFLACVGTAAALTAVLALVVTTGAVQVLVFAALSLLSILVIRPMVVHAMGMDSVQHTGEISHVHMAGRRAVVTQPVDAHGGQIRIGQGEFWTAKLFSGDETLPPGEVVEIMYVDGVTAHVAPVPRSPTLESDNVMSIPKGDS